MLDNLLCNCVIHGKAPDLAQLFSLVIRMKMGKEGIPTFTCPKGVVETFASPKVQSEGLLRHC